MAITVYGVGPSIGATQWSQLFEAHALGAGLPHVVRSGLVVSPAAGSRVLSVSAGVAAAPGVLVVSDAAETMTLDATPASRLSIIALQVDWSKPAAGAGTLVEVKGAANSMEGITLPGLAKTPGGEWQIPLATAEVHGGQFVANDLESMAPIFDTGWLALQPGGAWTNTNYGIRRRGSTVTVAGRMERTNAQLTVGTQHDFGGFTYIPQHLRPPRQVFSTAWWDVTGTPKSGMFLVNPNGSTLLVPQSAAIAVGDSVRFSTSWEI